MLRAQGWEPGQYLGAKDAAHAEWHTEASTSHIRVVLKDDNLGLGAKRNNGDECTGLDAFQHLLGRLNGKSEEVLETEKKARDDLKLNLYVERKIGTIRFVSGGWLVGDQLQEKPVEEKTGSPSVSEAEAAAGSVEEAEVSKSSSKRSKKRKAEESQEEDSKKRSKKEKKKRKAEAEPESDSAISGSKDEKKSSKKRKAEDIKDDAEDSQSTAQDADLPAVKVKETKEERKERKAREKREKKERKEKRKSEKGKDGPTSTDEQESAPPASTSLGSTASTPSGSGYSTPVMGSARYLARSRFIAQKKMAFTDTSALNQVSLLSCLGRQCDTNL